MTLTMAPQGESYVIHKITGKDEVRKYLAGLGFVTGSDVRVISELNGNVIINIRDVRIAIDKTLSNRIIVKEVGK